MTSKYNCSQADLYMACRISWWQCQKNLPAMAAKKAKYTAAYIEEKLDDINNADMLPDVHARYAEYDLMSMALKNSNMEIKAHFDLLLSYINDAFVESERDIMYRSAGKPFYVKAKKNIWPSVSALLNTAIPFIERYKDSLETTYTDPSVKNNMPKGFLDDFKILQTKFNGLYQKYLNSDDTGINLTSEKIAANNAIYKDTIAMLSDATLIFSLDPDLREEFTFTNALHKARGTKQAGISGFITNSETQKPIVGVEITIKDSPKVTLTNDLGRFEIFPMMAGFYTLTIKAEHFEPLTLEATEVKLGTMTRVNIALVPELALEPA
jgi:hypothetical protein